MNLQPAVLVVVSRLLKLQPRRVTHERQDARSQLGVVLEQRIENEHADGRGLSLFNGLHAEPAVRSHRHFRIVWRIVAIHFVDVHELLKKESNHVFVDSDQRLRRVFRPGLNECGDPLLERLSNELILAPAIEIDESSDLAAGDKGQQIHAVCQSDSLHSEENFLERRGLDEADGLIAGQKVVELRPVFDSKSRTR